MTLMSLVAKRGSGYGGEVTPPADAALAMYLMPAMIEAGPCEWRARSAPGSCACAEFQSMQAAWSRDWPYGKPPLREVEVEHSVRNVL